MTRALRFLAFAVLYLFGAAGLLVWMVVWLIPSILLLELRWAIHGKPEGATAPGYLPKWTSDRKRSVSEEKAYWERALSEQP